jgi:hypothetical protein
MTTESAAVTPPTLADIASMFTLTDRVVMVTGASGGLGERFARVAHAAGATVIAAARRADRLQALAAELPRLHAVSVDVTQSEDLQRLVDRTIEQHSRVDVLVNNAGGGKAVAAIDEPVEDFLSTLQLNVVGPFELARLVGRHMLLAGRGSVINIASVLGLGSAWPIPNSSYSTSKGAVIQLTRELGCQWAAGGVRVNAIAPGFFPSEAMAASIEDPQFVKHIQRHCPAGRVGRTDELDGAFLFLASDASTYVTGQVLAVDGGWTAH